MKIVRWDNGETIIERECGAIKGLVELAVREGISLYRAELNGAELSGAELSGAELNGAKLNGAKGAERLKAINTMLKLAGKEPIEGADLKGSVCSEREKTYGEQL